MSLSKSLFIALCGAVVLAGAPPASAQHGESTFTVVSGRTTVHGGEEFCFTLDRTTAATERVRVRLRFVGAVPRGWLTLDGARSASFRDQSEELVFVVDPRGVHRLTLELDDRGTADWLSVAAEGATVVQTSCASYDFYEERNVDLRPETPVAVDRLERDRDRTIDNRIPPPPPPPATTTAQGLIRGGTIPAGQEVNLTLEREISTQSAYVGQAFQSRLADDVVIGGRVLLPAGTRVTGHVTESKDAGRFGRSSLKLGFDEAVLADGTRIPVQGTVQRLGKGSAKKQGGIIAGSAVGGALLGKVLGGNDDDALWGAILGGSIAAGSIAAKEGEPIVLPAGTQMTITLDTSTSVPDRR